MFVPNFKILGAVVPEKSLTEKSLHTDTHTQTNIVLKRKNNIPPHTLYARGIKRAITQPQFGE